MVGFDITKQGALQSKNRVENEEDYWGTERKRMEGIWKSLGKPRYIRKSEAK